MIIELFKEYGEFDNFDKHNLSLCSYEKFGPNAINKVEYYLKITDVEHAVSDFLTRDFERKIKIAIIELLDNIFFMASPQYNPARYYVQYVVDPVEDEDINQYISSRPLSQNILPVVVRTCEDESGHIMAKSANMCPSFPIPKEIYLAVLDQENIAGMINQGLSKVGVNSFDVKLVDGTTKEYVCLDNTDKTATYFHFKKYVFSPNYARKEL